MPGTLYIVATPIGNLEDITYRAVRILREVDVIACEDTRQTQKLLQRYEIHRPLLSYHDHNEVHRTADLLARLDQGQNIALVSDAGTPLIADPGYRIVTAARERDLPVVPVPGPSATLTALSAAGLPTDSFTFVGFLPSKASARQRVLASFADRLETLIFYEAPHRILETLAAVEEFFHDRPLVLARELTKTHEEFLHGTAKTVRAALAERPAVKGEITLIIGGSTGEINADVDAVAEVRRLMGQGVGRMEAMKQAARAAGLSKRDVYQLLETAGDSPGEKP